MRLQRGSIPGRLFVVATAPVGFPGSLRNWFWSWLNTHILYVFFRTVTTGFRSQPDKPALLTGDLCPVLSVFTTNNRREPRPRHKGKIYFRILQVSALYISKKLLTAFSTVLVLQFFAILKNKCYRAKYTREAY